MYRGQLELDDVQPVIYMFLPLAHVLARLAQTVVLDVGGTLAYWSGDSAKILEEHRRGRADALRGGAADLREAAHRRAERRGELAARTRAVFAWALEVGRRARAAERAGRPLGRVARARLRPPTGSALAKVRELFGARLKMALVGAAPIDTECSSSSTPAG